ncbi:MAG: filamentous hemagglutinin N-terminal domain-containing protein [Nitrospira sp.]|nr:MAG: filamentous hemagglutinin N-terminal domain-containing protein [Nitrospira sp.]
MRTLVVQSHLLDENGIMRVVAPELHLTQSSTPPTPPVGHSRWRGCILLMMVLSLPSPWCAQGLAQTAPPITPSGLTTQVDLSSTPPTGRMQYDITGGTRAGTNLFHSFGIFNVPTGVIANFLNDTSLDTTTILSRVTGGQTSTIFGTIQTSGFGQANFFLMNPAGIVVGPTASLNVGGSVAFTTAAYLRFADNGRFHAVPNAAADALLSTAPVAAYGFLSANPGTITIQGSELIASEISLVGRNIAIGPDARDNGTVQRAQLSAPNGTIRLASGVSPGEFDAITLQSVPNLDGASFTSFGSIVLAPDSTVNVRETSTVSIRGGQFLLNVSDATLSTAEIPEPPGTVVLNNASRMESATFGTESGAGVHIISEESVALRANSSIAARTMGAGSGGHVSVTAPTILLQAESNIVTATGGRGAAGNVDLQGNQITLATNSSVLTGSQAEGRGGDITIRGLAGTESHAQDVTLSDASRLVSETLGDGVNTQGPAGQILIRTERLSLSGASQLNSTSRGSTGAAGNISVRATDSMRVSGSGTQLISNSMEFSSGDAGHISVSTPLALVEKGGTISSTTSLTGNAGPITITANRLQLLSGGRVTSRSLVEFPETPPTGSAGTVTVHGLTHSVESIQIDGSGSGIFTDTQGQGLGGTITLRANTITLDTGGTISTETSGTSPTATGGSILIHATDQVSLANQASIRAGSTGTTAGNAGDVTLNAGHQLEVRDGSSITTATESPQANGGNITIQAIDQVRFVDSTLSTSVRGTDGSGGNIFIDPKVVVLQGSEVTAKAIGGAGGNIVFVTPLFLADSTSVVSASSQRGPSGTVTIQSPTSNLSSAVGQLVSKITPPQILIQNRCVTSTPGAQSTFIFAGRDTLPAEPGGWIKSPVAMNHWTGENTEHASGLIVRNRGSKSSPSLATQKDNATVLSLRRLTQPGFLVQTFASGSTDCSS